MRSIKDGDVEIPLVISRRVVPDYFCRKFVAEIGTVFLIAANCFDWKQFKRFVADFLKMDHRARGYDWMKRE